MHLTCEDRGWIPAVQEAINTDGFAVCEGFLTPQEVEHCRSMLYVAQERIVAAIGEEKLQRAREHGVLRILMKYEPYFIRLLSNRHLLDVVDTLLSPTAILHLQNGFILPSFPRDKVPEHFQSSFHRDFPRYLNGYRASVNVLLAIDDFTSLNGATRVVPRSHQQEKFPEEKEIQKRAITVECPAGSAVIFDSTLWHASGANVSGQDRLAINHQFTRSFLKQQIDYVRALTEEVIGAYPNRTQQLLGYYTRVPISLDEYYRPEDERIYRKGQG